MALCTYGNAQIKVTLKLPSPCTNTSVTPNNINKPKINLTLSPNPSDGFFSINLSSSKIIKKAKINVIDTKGNILYSENIFCASSTCIKKMDLSHFISGIYILSIKGTYFNKQQKFIIKK